MLIIRLMIILTTILLSATISVAEDQLTLADCFNLALKRNERVAIRDEDIKVVEAQYDQAFGAIFPKLHAVATERLQDASSGSGGSGFTSSSFENNGSSKDTFQGYFNLKQPIFSGFREFEAARALKGNLAANQKLREREKQLLYFDTAQAFFQILLYQGDLQILSETEKILIDRIAELTKWITLGKSKESEVLAAKSDLADLRVTIESTKGLLDVSFELMRFILDQDPTSLRFIDSPQAKHKMLDAYLSILDNRPDILAFKFASESAGHRVLVAKGEQLPTVSLEGNYFVEEHPENDRDWNLLFRFDLPIFEGGIIQNKILESESKLRSSRLTFDQAKRLAEREVRSSFAELYSSIEQTKRINELVLSAKKSYEAQLKDYGNGIVTNLDVLQSLRRWHDAQRSLLNAQIASKLNFHKLIVASGDLAT